MNKINRSLIQALLSTEGPPLRSTPSMYASINFLLFSQVDKAKFKIGTLDSLMELNEALVKVDQTLESTVKKMEKIVSEIEILYKNSG